MSAFFEELGGLAGGAGASALALAAAIAAGRALEPAAVEISQDAWNAAPVRRLGAGTAATAAAQALAEYGAMESEASYSGFDASRFAYLYHVELTAPGLGSLMSAMRRGTITDAQWTHGLRKAKIEPQYDDALRNLLHTPLAPGELGTAVHRGIMSGPDLLVTSPPTTPGNIPSIPPSDIDPVAQAAAWGMSHEQLRVLVGITGLPLSLGEMLQLLNRGIVTEDDVKRAVAESNIRNEYMDVAIALRRRLLTSREWAEAELRGIVTHDVAAKGAADVGLETADYVTLFETVGRPLNVHAITTGEARGGKWGGTYDDVPDETYRDAIRRSNIRPEYAQLAYANRFSYPSLFQLSRLVSSGEITGDTAVEWARKGGLAPEVVDALGKEWGKTAATADTHVGKAQTTAWTKAQSAYLSGGAVASDVEPVLTVLGVSPEAQTHIVTLWDSILAMQRKQLSVAEIKKAYKEGVVNPATGVAWTQPEAMLRLSELGYGPQDATTILEL